MLYVCVCISCLQSEVQEERVIGLSRGSCPLLPILVQAQRGSSFRVKSSEMTISGAIPRKQYEMLCYNPKIAHVCYRPKRKKKKKKSKFPFSQKYVITQILYFLVERYLTLFPLFLEE